MIDIDALKESIAVALAGTIGTYTFSGGLTTPAIRVDDGIEPYEEEPAIEGLEVVIQPERSISAIPLLAGDRRVDLRSAIVLKQWDITQNTRAAREALISSIDFDSVGALMPRSTKLDSIETFTIYVDHSFHIFG